MEYFPILLFFVILILHSKGDEDYERRMHPKFMFNKNPYNNLRSRRAMPKVHFDPPESIEELIDYWNDLAQNTLEMQLETKNNLNKNQAKNIILFLGDGLSIPTITAGRVFMGGEEKQFSFEKFPYVGLSKTYCANAQVADSSCTSTAYLCGVKANFGTVGVSAAVDLDDCNHQNDTSHHVSSIAQWAQDQGMLTGFVTTTSVTHASPAGVYAHSVNRNWENDGQVLMDGGNPEICSDIASQLLNNPVGYNLRVIMGGGRENFLPNTTTNTDGGKRTDNRNLIDEWNKLHNNYNTEYVETRGELLKIPNSTDFVLGLFDNNHMPFHLDADPIIYPTLSEMVEKSLDILQYHETNDMGYFLFVEGGRIDHGHHETQAIIAIDETIEFDKAIDLVRKRTSIENTLIVVTADHSHTMSLAGYSSRKNNIFGINNGQLGNDMLPYATLSYANGPGFIKNIVEDVGKRKNLREIDMHDKHYQFPTTVPLDSETHGGDDVPVYASGPYAHIFTGAYEQNYIPHAMAYAACIGNKKTACN